MGHRPPTSVRVRVLERLLFDVVSKYWQYVNYFFRFVTKQACDGQTADGWTDRRTDRITVTKTALA